MLHRRRFMSLAGAAGVSGWLSVLAAESAKDPARKRNCILIWMSGGPTQTDTFDPKPGHANGGAFKATAGLLELTVIRSGRGCPL